METNTQPNELLLSWQAPAVKEHDRSTRWYVAAGIVAVALTAYGIMMHDWVFSVIVLLATGVYFLLRNERAKEYAISIFENGIQIDDQFQEWENWESFWILVGDGHGELHMKPAKSKRVFTVLLGNLDPFMVRDALLPYLTYDTEKKEKMVDAFIRLSKL